MTMAIEPSPADSAGKKFKNWSMMACRGLAKERVIKNVRKPKEAHNATETECSSRGLNADQLAWVRACRTGDVAACRSLLETNKDFVHYVAPFYLNYTAVHVATLGRNYDLLRLLKSKGANFNATTRAGYTPLHLAAQNHDKETARILIEEFGVDTRIHDLLGFTYEYYADWLDYSRYECSNGPFYNGAGSRSPSRQPSVGSLDSLASSKTSFSRNGSIRDTIIGLLHIPTMGSRSRSPSLGGFAI